MSNMQIVHETIIRDIVDVISSVKDSESLPGIFNKKSIKSVTKATEALTLVFPVICSKNMAIENASMVSKAIERKAVGMLQMLFSAICISDAKDAIDYVSRFHTNMKFDDQITVDGLIDGLDAYVANQESAGNPVIVDREKYEAVKKDLRNLNYYLPESISESSLSSFKVNRGRGLIINEARGGKNNTSNSNNNTVIDYSIRDSSGDRNSHNTSGSYNRTYNALDNSHTTTNIYQGGRPGGGSNNASDMKNHFEAINKQILPSDIKKANELVATNMIINFVSTGGDQPIEMNNIVIGVKAKLYAVDSMDIINRIISKNKDKNVLFNFIRATTREISFWKDFVFAIDKAKVDALSSSGRGSSSKIWKLLERRALKSRINRSLGITNTATAITTLVVTQEEVEYLKKNERIDLEKSSVARGILNSYNLMGLVIVDEAMEVAKFIFDTGDDMYEHLSFSHLEREGSDNGYKKVINLMTKMAR